MEDSVQQNIVGGRNRRLQELISGSGDMSLRPADWLLKLNLPPLMGRRDAAFDIAEQLVCRGDFASCEGSSRFEGYWQISRLLKDSCRDSRQILPMLSNPDTRDRERRMLAHSLMMDSLGASLANFFELRNMSLNDTCRDAMGALNEDEAGKIISVLNEEEHDLLNIMRESFNRSHWRVVRYRTYAGKSFSPENAGRYERAYSGCVKHNEALLNRFGVSFEHKIQF